MNHLYIVILSVFLFSCSSSKWSRSQEINSSTITIDSICENPNLSKASLLGEIYHSETDELLSDVIVELTKGVDTQRVQTDDSGAFKFYDISGGKYVIRIDNFGYFELHETIDLEFGKRYLMKVQISPRIEDIYLE